MCSLSGRHTNSLFLVVDLSLLRGETREAHLSKMTSVVSRAWMQISGESQGGDVNFGFSIYDSHVGGYMLSYQLNMVAKGMGIPKNVATTTGYDLNGDDLINFLTLITLITDKNVVKELNLRESRSSRSSDIPAVETSKVLHTVLKSPYMHKIPKVCGGNSSSSDDSFYGYLVIFTPSVGAKDVLHGYVGKDAMEETGCIEEAFLKHLPLSMWGNIASHKLSCAWVSGNSEEDCQGILNVIEERIKTSFPSFSMNSLDALSAPRMTRQAFADSIGFLAEEEASSMPRSGTQTAIDLFWRDGNSHASIEFLQTSMAAMRPLQALISPLKTKSLKIKRSSRVEKKEKTSKKDLQKAIVGRGKRAMKNARDVVHRTSDKPDSKGACQHTNSTVNQHNDACGDEKDCLFDDVSPLNVGEAVSYARENIAALKTQIFACVKQAGCNDISIADKALKGLQCIVSKSFKSIEKLRRSDSGVPDFAVREVQMTFLKEIPMTIPDLQKMHKTTNFEEIYTVSWTATIEILLRLLILSYLTKEDEMSEGMDVTEYAAVEDAMHIIVATMSPIPSQGHALFLKVIKPTFLPLIEYDIKELEKAIWDEEEIAVDGDGSLVGYRIAAASLEESGETPGDSDISMQGDETNKNVDNKHQRYNRAVHAKVAACKEPARSNSHGPACSAEGSGVQGSTIGAAIVSGARSKLSQSSLISRRFNNSKQYGMQVRANRTKPKNRPAATKKQQGQNIQKVGTLRTKEQIPDTPQDKKRLSPNQKNKECDVDNKQAICSTPDTAMVKQAGDIIPNTSPRGDTGKDNHISRIGAIRQPVFDDGTVKNMFENADDDDLEINGLKNKGTWLSGAVIRRKRVANSIASRMGDINSSEQPTNVLARKDSDTNKEVMSPLKPSKPRGEQDILHEDDDCNDDFHQETSKSQYDIHNTDEEEEERHTCEIRVLLPSGTTTCQNDTSNLGAQAGSRQKNSDDTEQNPIQVEVPLNVDLNSNDYLADGYEALGELSRGSDSMFDTNKSDDEDSMAARNECPGSEDSSLQPCAEEGVTSPSGGNKENQCNGIATPRKTPLSNFDEALTPLAKSNRDISMAGKRNPKGGRLAKMLAGPSNQQLHKTPPSCHADRHKGSPGNQSITVEDRGSPCKPSPGSGSFGSLPKQSTPRALDYSSDTDSCVGDSPDVVIAMKPLIQTSQDNDSDEEDAAILNAAANGGLSPTDEANKPKPAVRRKRRRSLLAATKGLIDSDVRKKVKQAPRQPLKTPTEQVSDVHEKQKKRKQLHLTNPPIKQRKKVKEKSNKKKMCQMPLEEEEVICSLTVQGETKHVHCIIKKICEAQLRGTKGWICHAEVLPIQIARLEPLEPQKVKLDSSKEVMAGCPLDEPGSWCRADSSSPVHLNIVPSMPNETVAHDMAVKSSKDIIRQESITILKASETHGAVALSSPRRKLQPCNLKYEGEALASAQKIQSTPPENLIQSRFRNFKGVELFPETAQISPSVTVSPEARAAAGNMLGSLYPHLNPLVSSKVLEILTSPLGQR